MKRLILLAMLVLFGCSTEQKFDKYRSAVRNVLRDPASAEFKDESIRTLWSEDGSRYKVYCAMVNANNAFGGKTGFEPATVVISLDLRTKGEYFEIAKSVHLPGKVFIDEAITPSYYMNCQRGDVKRANGSVIFSWPTFGRPWDKFYKEEIDRAAPVLSNDLAP